MSRKPYSYCALRYMRDPSAQESLNFGVVVYSPENDFLVALVDDQYRRLSAAFGDFDGEHHRRVLLRLQHSLSVIRDEWKPTLLEQKKTVDVGGVMKRVWPDQGWSYQYGEVLAGLTYDLDAAAEELFQRFVLSQRPSTEDERRTDDQVWSNVYRRPLAAVQATKVLQPRKVVTPDAEFEFSHAFKNGATHILQPVSMDLVRPESIQKKAIHWRGMADQLREAEGGVQLYLLLGKPTRETNLAAYERGKRIIERGGPDVRLVDEEQAEAFADELAGFMREHELLK